MYAIYDNLSGEFTEYETMDEAVKAAKEINRDNLQEMDQLDTEIDIYMKVGSIYTEMNVEDTVTLNNPLVGEENTDEIQD